MRSILLAIAALALSAAADAQPAPGPAQGPGPAATPAPAPLAINWDRVAEGVGNCERDSANAPHDWGCDVGLVAANSELAYVRLGCDCRPTVTGRRRRQRPPNPSGAEPPGRQRAVSAPGGDLHAARSVPPAVAVM